MMSKVVLSQASDGKHSLRIDSVCENAQFRRVSGSELHLGSQDLIRLAAYASRIGFQVSSLIIADANLVPLPADEAAELSEDMLSMLHDFGSDELEAAMRDEFSGLYVIAVNLIAAKSGRRISIRRHGYVETSVVNEAEKLLKAAWQELQLT
ncbi:hypothetical protein [Micrococcoides hystricis]|uniref:Uncharacterized protein n=1 Tax=Micrococcoides hystricis TaxID=1572761 RepID=A0ABV6P7M2_9MICC